MQLDILQLRCRLTYNKNRKDFSTGITVNPDHWDPKKQRLLDQSDQEETTSMQLSLIENKISKAFLMLLGHSKMATTQQSYGKIVQRKAGDEMSVTNSRIHSDNKERDE